jgi:glycosyltransferase involved in cell wall biosynthesis
VDDCSTDRSKTVCEGYVEKYPRLFTLLSHSENQGVSVARNDGVSAARGEFFAFVDPDDLVPPNAFQDLYNAAVAHKADVVKGNFTIFNENKTWNASYNTKTEQVYRGDEILSVFYEHKKIRGHICGKLFRMSSFSGIKSVPGVTMCQDALYCAEVFHHAEKLVLINTTVYHYRSRKYGCTGRKFETKAYTWWLYSIEKCGCYAKTKSHAIKHKQLQIRTLLLLAKEARRLHAELLPEVLDEIAARQKSWNLMSVYSVLQQKVSVHSLLDYLIFQRTMNKLKRKSKGMIAGARS